MMFSQARHGIVVACLVAFAAGGRAQPREEFAGDREQPTAAVTSPSAPPAAAPTLSLPAALRQALENNPGLAAQRRLRGIAAARVVIADTYPFNPTLETRIQRAHGPFDSGVTNKTPFESLLLWEVELRGQRQHRRDGAVAALSRTEWEIVAQEQALSGQVIRAYAGLQYRQEKVRLLDETLKLNERLVEDIRGLIKANKLKINDQIVAESEVFATRSLLSGGRESETAARQDLLRALGLVEGTFEIEGAFEPPAWAIDPVALTDLTLARRADLKASQLAVAEAAANVRLANANRYGNPIVGPAVGYDPSKIATVGAQINIPLPVANTRRGELFQAEAEHAKAAAGLRQIEINVRQDVASALARLKAAEQSAEQYRTSLPKQRQAVEDMEKLFQAGEAGVGLLQVIDVRRNFLKAKDGYLDALLSVRQARADLAAAVGEPALGLTPPGEVPPPARMGVPKK